VERVEDDRERHLERVIGEAEAALPSVPSDRARTLDLISKIDRDPFAIDRDSIEEVILAIACAENKDARALAIFEERYVANVATAIAHLKLDPIEIDEVKQLVRDRLLVADGEPPKILGYAGRGSLRGLVKVIAVRAGLDRLRRLGREVGDAPLADLPSPAHDPELAFLKDRYRSAFAEAFAEAASQLDQRERNLLRLHHLGGVTLDELARMYGMHRATVVRQLAKVRASLLSETRKGLRKRLSIGPDELESIMELIQSRFEISVERMLRSIG
jgi:RNA polymerase sigma-70 factor, ECF subfamily